VGAIDQVGAFERKVRTLCEGFCREFPPSEEKVLFGGRTMTVAEVVTALNRMMEMLESVHRTHLAFRQAVGDRRRAAKSHRATYEDAVFLLKHRLGRENPRLASFGVALPKARRRLSNEAKAIARAKAEATRRARGTMSKKQRLALGKPPEPTLQVLGSDGQPLLPAAEASIEGEPKPTPEVQVPPVE
jgi:hypothetical protein